MAPRPPTIPTRQRAFRPPAAPWPSRASRRIWSPRHERHQRHLRARPRPRRSSGSTRTSSATVRSMTTLQVFDTNSSTLTTLARPTPSPWRTGWRPSLPESAVGTELPGGSLNGPTATRTISSYTSDRRSDGDQPARRPPCHLPTWLEALVSRTRAAQVSRLATGRHRRAAHPAGAARTILQAADVIEMPVRRRLHHPEAGAISTATATWTIACCRSPTPRRAPDAAAPTPPDGEHRSGRRGVRGQRPHHDRLRRPSPSPSALTSTRRTTRT